jgi:glutathione S-transferase
LSAEFLRISPIGKVPILQDDSITMAESGAMVHYLIDKYGKGKLRPETSSPQYPTYLEWSWFAEATFTSSASEIIRHKRAFPGDINIEVIDEFKRRATFCLNALTKFLGEKKWLLGESFSGADIMMGIALTTYARHVAEPFTPMIQNYFDRLSGRPAFMRTKEAES